MFKLLFDQKNENLQKKKKASPWYKKIEEFLLFYQKIEGKIEGKIEEPITITQIDVC